MGDSRDLHTQSYLNCMDQKGFRVMGEAYGGGEGGSRAKALCVMISSPKLI